MGRHVPALLVSLAACGGDSRQVEEAGRYVRPVVRELVARAKPAGPVATAALVFEAIERDRAEEASKAVWAAVERAETRGLLELYGAEWFGLEPGAYRAILFVRSSSGARCLYADARLHGARDDPGTVPAQPVVESDFAALGSRIGVHLPFSRSVSLESPVEDGEIVLVHVLREGRSHTALWYAPARGFEPEQAAMAVARASYPVAAIVDALWAGAPLTLFPRGDADPERTYAGLPAEAD
jgi:hypothetical protein